MDALCMACARQQAVVIEGMEEEGEERDLRLPFVFAEEEGRRKKHVKCRSSSEEDKSCQRPRAIVFSPRHK